MTLYEISEEYKSFLDYIEGMTDEQIDNFDDSLKETGLLLEGESQKKIINIGKIIKNLQSDKAQIKEEKERFAKKEQVVSKKIDNLVNYVTYCMNLMEMDSIIDPIFSVKLVNCPPSAQIYDENMIPEDYKSTKTEIKIDRRKLLSDLKVLNIGSEIPGSKLIQNKRLKIG